MGQTGSKENPYKVPDHLLNFPQPIRHYHSLSNDRLLAYYTFRTGEPQPKPDSQHPILYFHGFPGCGVEGAKCAKSADLFGCKVYGIDRPGFGSSEPLPNQSAEMDPDTYMQGFIDEVWDFVHAKRWKRFSVIGVSGGGPYALAMLERYLAMTTEENDGDDEDDNSSKADSKASSTSSIASVPKLMAVCVVAGIACGAGTEGMIDMNKKLLEIIMSGGYWGTLFLKWNLALQSFLVSYLPTKWLISLCKSMWKSLPDPDLHLFQSQPGVVVSMMEDLKESFRQGSKHAFLESRVLFRKSHGFEVSLMDKWAAGKKGQLPKVSLYQGGMDVNVPASHSRYVQKTIFGGEHVQLREYPKLGHISLIVNMSDEYVQSAAPV